MEFSEQVRERLRRRFLHRQDLDLSMADLQTISVAFHGGVRREIVHVRVVAQLRRVDDPLVVVDKFPEQSERVGFRESFETDITELDLERVRLVVERRDRAIEVVAENAKNLVWRQPMSNGMGR